MGLPKPNFEFHASDAEESHELKCDPLRMRVVAIEHSPFILTYKGEFVFLLRCEEGELGEIVHCNCMADAVKAFGNDTFDRNKEFFDAITYICIQVFQYVPAYICRVNRPKVERI